MVDSYKSFPLDILKDHKRLLSVSRTYAHFTLSLDIGHESTTFTSMDLISVRDHSEISLI